MDASMSIEQITSSEPLLADSAGELADFVVCVYLAGLGTGTRGQTISLVPSQILDAAEVLWTSRALESLTWTCGDCLCLCRSLWWTAC